MRLLADAAQAGCNLLEIPATVHSITQGVHCNRNLNWGIAPTITKIQN